VTTAAATTSTGARLRKQASGHQRQAIAAEQVAAERVDHDEAFDLVDKQPSRASRRLSTARGKQAKSCNVQPVTRRTAR
jgi:hypothetical protein